MDSAKINMTRDGAADLMARAKTHTPDWVGQAALLLAAATTLIERELGAANAGVALTDLLQPTWEDWSMARKQQH